MKCFYTADVFETKKIFFETFPSLPPDPILLPPQKSKQKLIIIHHENRSLKHIHFRDVYLMCVYIWNTYFLLICNKTSKDVL